MVEKTEGGFGFGGLPSFFGGDSGLTYEELKRRRAIAAALAGRGTPVKDLPSGMTAFGEGLGALIGDMRLRQMEAQSAAYNAKLGTGAAAPVHKDYTPGAQKAVQPAPPPWKADQRVLRPDWPTTPPPPSIAPPQPPGTPGAAGVPVAQAPVASPADVAEASANFIGGDFGGPDAAATTAAAPDLGGVATAPAPPPEATPPPEVAPDAAAVAPTSNLPPVEQPPPTDIQPDPTAPPAAAAPPVGAPIAPLQNLPGTNPNQDMLIQAVRARREEVPAAALPMPADDPATRPLSARTLVGGSRGTVADVPRGIENLHPATRDYANLAVKDFPGVKFRSGYRDPQTNKDVGGARGSQHIQRRALDVEVPPDQQEAFIRHAYANGARGFGHYGGNTIHVDFREGPVAGWGPNYSRTSLPSTPAFFQKAVAEFQGGAPAAPQTASAVPSDRPTITPLSPEGVPITRSAAAPAAAGAPQGDDAWARYSPALAKMESSESKTPYDLVGPQTKGGRAIGKYQIMSDNVGPWTKAALGKPMTPAEFRANPEAQEATAKHRFMQYVAKYGPEGAARAWYAGEGGMNNPAAMDINRRINVAQYGQQFAQHAGESPGAAPAGPARPTFAAGSEPKDLRSDIATAIMMQGGEQAPPTEQVASAPAEPAESRGRIAATLAGLPSRPGGRGPQTAALGGGAVGMPTPQQTVSPIVIPPEQTPPRPQPQQPPPVGPQVAQAGGVPAASWFTPSIGPAPNVAQPPPQQQPNIPPAPNLRPEFSTPTIPPRLQADDYELERHRIIRDPRASDARKEQAKAELEAAVKERTEQNARNWKIYEEAKGEEARKQGLQQGHLANEKQIRDLEGEGFFPLSKEEMAGLPALPPGQVVYKNRRGELKFGPTPPSVITIDQKGEGEFAKTNAQSLGKMFAGMTEAGISAGDDLDAIANLRMSGVQTGGMASMTAFLSNYGIKLPGASEVEFYGAMIDRLTPQQRLPGSGNSTDFDARMFKSSLPSLMRTPEGNAMIMDVMEGIAKNKMDRADVALRVQTGELSPQDGVREIRRLQLEAKTRSDGVRDYVKEQQKLEPSKSDQEADAWLANPKNFDHPAYQEIRRRRGK